MKTSFFLLPISCVAFAVGCSDSAPKADAPVAATPTPPPTGLAAMPGKITQTKDVVAAVNANAAKADAVTAPETTASKVTAAAKEALPLLLEQLKSQAAASNSANQPKIADLLGTKVSALTGSFAPAQQQGLGTGVEGLLGGLVKGDASSALSQLGGLLGQTGSMNTQQKDLVGEVRNLASAWLIDKQFAGTALEGKAGPLIQGLMKNEWAQSLLGLKSLGTSKDLSAGQKGLLDSFLEQFAPEGLKGAGGALDLLKGLGK